MTSSRFALLLALMALLLYLPTWSPVITWSHSGEDGPELEMAGRILGAPHPTGYPLFMLFVRLVSLVVPTPLSAVNLLTLLAALGAVSGIGLASRNLARMSFGTGRHDLVAGTVGALVFATSLTAWRQAVIGEVYTLHIAILAWILVLLFSSGPRHGILVAYLLGLGLAHHLQIVPVALLVGVYLLARGDRPRAMGAVALLIPMSLYGVLMLRSRQEPRLDWGNPESLDGLLWTLQGTPYQGNLFAGGLANTLDTWLTALSQGPPAQVGWGWTLLALLGTGLLIKRQPREAGFLLLLFLGTSFVASAYAIPDPGAYYLPATLAVAMLAGIGAAGFVRAGMRMEPGGFQRLAASVVSLAILTGFAAERILGVAPHADAREDLVAFDYAVTGTRVLQPGALVISHGDGRSFALWYGTEVLEPRPDVAVLYDNLLGWPWYREQVRRTHPWIKLPPASLSRTAMRSYLIERHIDHRPVYVTEFEAELQGRLYVEPAGPLYRVRRQSLVSATRITARTSNETRGSETDSRSE